jgi:hypothetical protein
LFPFHFLSRVRIDEKGRRCRDAGHVKHREVLAAAGMMARMP